MRNSRITSFSRVYKNTAEVLKKSSYCTCQVPSQVKLFPLLEEVAEVDHSIHPDLALVKGFAIEPHFELYNRMRSPDKCLQNYVHTEVH